MSKLKLNKPDLDMEFVLLDGVSTSFRNYFYLLLDTLWDEQEGFSGKRPFGNSGWNYDLYRGLVINNVLAGTLDEDGYLETFDKDKADAIIFSMIKSLCGVS